MKKLRLYLRKYITMLMIDLGILLRPKSKGVMVIDESEWHYPFFNCDFIRTILSQTLSVLLQGYTPYIELKNRKNGETNWDLSLRSLALPSGEGGPPQRWVRREGFKKLCGCQRPKGYIYQG